MEFVKYDYRDLIVIRDLFRDVDGSDEPLNEFERAALSKTEKIIELMAQKRRQSEDNKRYGYDFDSGSSRDTRFNRFSRRGGVLEEASSNQR